MPLKLLHLSDIHFLNSKFDLDQDLRNEIERDLGALQKQLVKIDVVLVGGDVAYSASHEEYEKAYQWLQEICKIVNCSEENVLTIPGNHDVERTKICALVETAHLALKVPQQRTSLDSKLGKFLKQKESYTTLLKTFDNYEAFAQRYGSIPERESPLFWEKDFQLNGAKLRIRGINSSFVSNKGDDFHQSKLVVGSHQSTLKRENGIIYCVMCHHPPEWLYDGEDVEADLLSRAKLHLYGHKHKSKVLQQGQSLRLAAGAVHPERTEQDWEPRYNIIELDILTKNGKSYLEVRLWKRVWSKTDTCFIADFGKEGKEFTVYELELDPSELEVPKMHNAKNATKVEKMAEENVELINTSMPNPKRKLMYMFFSLPYHKKLNIAFELNLIEEEDKDLNELKKTKAYFERAENKNILSDLWDQVVKENNNEDNLANPFKK